MCSALVCDWPGAAPEPDCLCVLEDVTQKQRVPHLLSSVTEKQNEHVLHPLGFNAVSGGHYR